eukprot:4809995-Amphidinium_carterae.1
MQILSLQSHTSLSVVAAVQRKEVELNVGISREQTTELAIQGTCEAALQVILILTNGVFNEHVVGALRKVTSSASKRAVR